MWISENRLAQVSDKAEASPVLPEIVVEVLSEGNTEAEMAEKRQLYVDEGAREAWTGAEDGTMRFYDQEGLRKQSTLVPSFPDQVD